MRRKLVSLTLGAAALGALAPTAAANPFHSPGRLDSGFGSGGVASLGLHPDAADRFFDVTVGRGGRTYAAGLLNVGGGDHAMTVARITRDGELHPRFGSGGYSSVNVAPGRAGAEIARGVGVQSTGKVVIGGQAESSTPGADPRDLNIFVSRFRDDGRLDRRFGNGGKVELDLSPGTLNTAPGGSYRTDQAYGLVVQRDDKIVVVAARGPDLAKRPGRVDRDYAIIRLNKDGALDRSWGNRGIAFVNTRGPGNASNTVEDLNESPRQAIVQPDGKVVVGSYSEGSDTRAVMRVLRFRRNGTLDRRFGDGGIATAPGFFPGPSVAEAYDIGLQGHKYVIGGYGSPTTTGKVDVISARFTSDGRWDRRYGRNGRVIVDVAGDNDRARDLVVLRDGRILLAGSGIPNPPNLDAMFVMLTRDGSLVRRFGDGGKLLVDFGGGADSFFGLALTRSKNKAIASGYLGAATGGSTAVNPEDDGRAVRLKRLQR